MFDTTKNPTVSINLMDHGRGRQGFATLPVNTTLDNSRQDFDFCTNPWSLNADLQIDHLLKNLATNESGQKLQIV